MGIVHGMKPVPCSAHKGSSKAESTGTGSVGRITWLASYPKSGNTWLRAFLANYCGNADRPFDINTLPHFSHGEMAPGLYETLSRRGIGEISDEEVQRLRPEVHRVIASFDREPNFVKTHNAIAVLFDVPTITPEVTEAAVYVVRNPLDVMISYADHFGLGLDKTIEQISSASNRTATTEKNVFQYLGNWSQHVRSWAEAPGLGTHVVRYEDMLNRPTRAFGEVVAYLGLENGRERLRRAIRFSSFRVLKIQEERHGFYERSRHSRTFFRSGQARQWKKALTAQQIQAVLADHGEVMARYGYLS